MTRSEPADAGRLPVLRDGTIVAAWLLKANPAVWDVIAAVESGGEIDSWRMAPSYRTMLVAPGHPVVLWVTGPRGAAWTPGVWGIGTVTSEPYDDVGDPLDGGWFDLSARDRVRPYIRCRIRAVEPIARDELAADPRFVDAEILTSPRLGSPLAVTADELGAITDRVSHRRARRR